MRHEPAPVLQVAGALAALCVPAWGQGADCSTATPITIDVPSSYASGAFSTSGFTGGGTCPAVFLEFDAFWVFTAPADGNYLIQFSNAPMDMGMRVHRGADCTAVCIAAASNESSLVAEVGLTSATAGERFLVQAGVLNSGDGIADLLITSVIDPCVASGPDPFEPNDSCVESVPLAQGSYSGLNVATSDPDFYSVVVPAGNIVHVAETEDPLAAVHYRLLALSCGSFVAFGSEGLEWSNTSGVAQRISLEVLQASNPAFDCAGYGIDLSLTLDANQGTPFCDPMDPNSSNQSTHMTGLFVGGSGTGWLLSIDDGPLFQWGIVLVGSAGWSPGIAVGQGRLCLDTSGTHVVGRYNVAGTERNSVGYFAPPGPFLNASGTGGPHNRGFKIPHSLPLPGTPAIQPGETWHFQAWHRDLGGQSNFSNGLSILF